MTEKSKSKSKPKLSVIIPIYNAGKYLPECLESVISQSYTNLEIILVDDGSTDDSAKICRQYLALDKRVYFYQQKNSGVSAARNLGLQRANGEYVTFFDGDDSLRLDAYEKIIDIILKYDVDIVRCNEYIEQKNGALRTDSFNNIANRKITHHEILQNLHRFTTDADRINCFTPALTIKRNLSPSFNTSLYAIEDVNFYVKAFSSINSAYFLDEPLWTYRYNDSSAFRKRSKSLRNAYGVTNSIKATKAYLAEKNLLSPTFEKQIHAYAFRLTNQLIGKGIASIADGRKKLKTFYLDKNNRDNIFPLSVHNLTTKQQILYALIRLHLFTICAILISMNNRAKT